MYIPYIHRSLTLIQFLITTTLIILFKLGFLCPSCMIPLCFVPSFPPWHSLTVSPR